jgi:predicted nucleic acid-binding protein
MQQPSRSLPRPIFRWSSRTECGDLSAVIRRELATHSAHQGPSVPDLIVAATAIRMKLIVLHEDADFETVARFIPELQQQRVSVFPK